MSKADGASNTVLVHTSDSRCLEISIADATVRGPCIKKTVYYLALMLNVQWSFDFTDLDFTYLFYFMYIFFLKKDFLFYKKIRFYVKVRFYVLFVGDQNIRKIKTCTNNTLTVTMCFFLTFSQSTNSSFSLMFTTLLWNLNLPVVSRAVCTWHRLQSLIGTSAFLWRFSSSVTTALRLTNSGS